MILILSYVFLLVHIKNELKRSATDERLLFGVMTVAAAILAIPYRNFLISVGFKFGLANLDMQYYMDLAERIQDMSLEDGFRTISSHWNFALVNPIQIWGYRMYIYFLVICVFKTSVFSVTFSVYLVSILQVIVGEYATLCIYNSLKYKGLISHRIASLFFLLSAPAIWYGCVRLLREWIMLLCMSSAIKAVSYKYKNWKVYFICSLVVLFVLRPYYVVFLIPILMILQGNERKAMITASFFLLLLLGICLLMKIGPLKIVGVFLSPNFFNQVKILMQPASEVAKESGQIPIINYIGAVWNMLVLIYAVWALCFSKKMNSIAVCCAELIIGMSMIYAITYGGVTELRHKLFFVVPYVLIINVGSWPLSRERKNVVINIVFAGFVVIYTCIMMLDI